jgi:hypothetical protein
MEKEQIVIEVPTKTLHVEHAACPNGHSLMDPTLPIHGYPSIKTIIQYGNSKGFIHLDPIYGSFHNVLEIDLPEGVLVDLFCPTCQVSLKENGPRTCDWCFAPMFVLFLPNGGLLEGCLRAGCHQHKLKLVDVDAQLGLLHGQDQIQLLM